MRILFTFLFCFMAMVGEAAIPSFTAFLGTNGITVISNPTTGKILIDGSAISAATNTPSSSTNAIGAPITNLLWGRTLFVDSVNGRDATAIRGDASKPYLTASQAVANVQSGDTVLFRPGTYDVNPLPDGYWTNAPLKIVDKTNVVIAGLAGAKLQLTGLGSMWWVGRTTNVTFRDIEIVGVRTNNTLGNPMGAIVLWGNNRGLRFDRLNMHHFPNHGIATYNDGAVGFNQNDATVTDSYFEFIGMTNAFVGLPNDGAAVVLCGENVSVLNNRFKFNCRDIEVYNQDTYPQIWRNYNIIGNQSDGASVEFLLAAGTNIVDWTVVGNVIRMYGTNLPISTAQYGMLFWNGNGVDISGNVFEGCEYGIGGRDPFEVDGFSIRGNVFRNIQQIPINDFLSTGAGNAPKRVFIEGNQVLRCGASGITINATDSKIVNNLFMDTGTNGSGNHAIWLKAVSGVVTNATNCIIEGNVIVNQNGTPTDGSITVETKSYYTRLWNNQVGPGITGVANTGVSTYGMANGVGGISGGGGVPNFLGAAGAGSPGTLIWTLTNHLTGEGWWYAPDNRFFALYVTNNIFSSNIYVSYIYVTNTTSSSNVAWRAAETEWNIWAYELSEDLFFDNNSFGRFLRFDVANLSVAFHKPILATNATFVGNVTNLGAVKMEGNLTVTGKQTNTAPVHFTSSLTVSLNQTNLSDVEFQGALQVADDIRTPSGVLASVLIATNRLAVLQQTLGANLHLNGTYQKWRTNLTSGSIAVLVTNLSEGVTYRLDVDATGGNGSTVVTWVGLTSPGPAYPYNVTTYYVEKVGTTTNVTRVALSGGAENYKLTDLTINPITLEPQWCTKIVDDDFTGFSASAGPTVWQGTATSSGGGASTFIQDPVNLPEYDREGFNRIQTFATNAIGTTHAPATVWQSSAQMRFQTNTLCDTELGFENANASNIVQVGLMTITTSTNQTGGIFWEWNPQWYGFSNWVFKCVGSSTLLYTSTFPVTVGGEWTRLSWMGDTNRVVAYTNGIACFTNTTTASLPSGTNATKMRFAAAMFNGRTNDIGTGMTHSLFVDYFRAYRY